MNEMKVFLIEKCRIDGKNEYHYQNMYSYFTEESIAMEFCEDRGNWDFDGKLVPRFKYTQLTNIDLLHHRYDDEEIEE